MWSRRAYLLNAMWLMATWACREPTGVQPRPTFELAGYSPTECTNDLSLDHDGDAFEDACEYPIAFAFRPVLVFDLNENCPWRESYWSAYPLEVDGTTHFYIAYLLAYHRDCGGNLGFGIEPHDGDSEFIILDTSWDPASSVWKLQRAFLSAHWNSADGDNGTGHNRSATYDYNQFGYYDGRPVIIVSRNKHANYDGFDRCMAVSVFFGIASQESGCTNFSMGWSYGTVSEVEVRPDRNVGSSMFHLLNCTPSELPDSYTGSECFWSTYQFRGWIAPPNDGPTPTGYGTVLAFFEGRTGFGPRPDLGSFLAAMNGPSNIVQSGYYAWEVNADGGDGDYTYEWYYSIDGSPWVYLGSDKVYYEYFDTSMNQSPRFLQFQVTVRDGAGHVATMGYAVEEASSCGGDWCGGGN